MSNTTIIPNPVIIIVVLESIGTMRKMLTLKSLVAKSMFIRIGPNL
jgi:hypothetical protein